jgi:hypothetical protein
LNSVTLLRRLSSNSRKNEIYKAFREVGRSVRTVALLRYLADPALRRRVTAVTNKVEAYNRFAAWLRFGNGGVIADNDPAEQEKMIKFNSLLANCVTFHTALDMMEVIRRLVAEGWEVSAEDIAQLSPYITEHISCSACTPPTCCGSGPTPSTRPVRGRLRHPGRRRVGNPRRPTEGPPRFARYLKAISSAFSSVSRPVRVVAEGAVRRRVIGLWINLWGAITLGDPRLSCAVPSS